MLSDPNTERADLVTTRKRRPDDLRPRPERFLTNRTFTNALRNGSGPLAPVQRIALFLFGVTCVAGGIASLAIGWIIPRQDSTSSGIFYYASTAMTICFAILVGCG